MVNKDRIDSTAVTIEDVARQAGVSSMTVSRVLRGTGTVSKATTELVLHAMDELSYVPNRIASALAAAKATQIGVLVPTLESTVFTELLAGINLALDSTPHQAIIGITDYEPQKELSLIKSMLGWRPAGLIVVGTDQLPESKRTLLASGIPVVQAMELTRKPIDMCVGVDQLKAGAKMANHMIDKGYKNFAYLGSDHAIDGAAKRRFDGFNRTLKKNGLVFKHVISENQISNVALGKKLMARIAKHITGIDAVYCSNDSVAVGALLQCMQQRIEVPNDIAIASFSGLDLAMAMPVQITTIISPRKDMGRTSAQMILNRLDGKKIKPVVNAGFKLFEGGSC